MHKRYFALCSFLLYRDFIVFHFTYLCIFSIVWIMILPRYSIIVFLALLTSCTPQGVRPVDTIVDISTA